LTLKHANIQCPRSWSGETPLADELKMQSLATSGMRPCRMLRMAVSRITKNWPCVTGKWPSPTRQSREKKASTFSVSSAERKGPNQIALGLQRHEELRRQGNCRRLPRLQRLEGNCVRNGVNAREEPAMPAELSTCSSPPRKNQVCTRSPACSCSLFSSACSAATLTRSKALSREEGSSRSDAAARLDFDRQAMTLAAAATTPHPL